MRRYLKDLWNRTIKWMTPMEYVGFAFTDAVSGKPVYEYRDVAGVVWLKESRFSSFKVRRGGQGNA